jgi:ELWxxDGT repeat protein
MGWRGGWVVSLLVVGVGCGGPLPEDAVESGLAQGPTSAPDVTAEAFCPPTEAGTQRVKTILPPSELGIPRFAVGPGDFADFQGTLHFAVNFEDGRRGLWRSTGTDAGTTQVRAFPATQGNGTPMLSQLTATPTRLFFQAADTATGSELWVSDGTTAGTRLVRDLTPGPADSYLTHLAATPGNTVVFIRDVYDAATGTSRYQLWRSDGTPAGTVLLRDFGTNVSIPYQDAKVNGTLRFFVRELNGGTSLWKTDGTAAGTVQLKRLDAGPNSYPFDVRTTGDLTLFTLEEETVTELWKSDGTAAGTVRLASFGKARSVRALGPLGAYAYVTTTSFATQYMVVYRVPLAGGNPTPVVTLPNDYTSQGEAFPYIDAVSQVLGGAKLYFAVAIGSNGPAPRDTQLWVTDGTAGGTTLLRRPLSLSDEYSSPLLAVSDNLVFFSSDGGSTAGIEPWVSNGTRAGTRRLKDISDTASSRSSYPHEFYRHAGRVYFSAYDDTLNAQLWSTALSNTCAAPE